MALPESTLRERITRVQNDLNVNLPGADAGIKRTAENALAHANAAAVHGLQGNQQYIVRQWPPGPDSDKETLEKALDLFGIPRKQPAAASGTIRITGVVGTNIETTDLWQLADGTKFALGAQATIAEQGTPDYVDAVITATVPGASGNAVVGSIVRLVNPVSGADSEAIVQDDGSGGGLTNGSDLESKADMWTRLHHRLSNPPGPGTTADFERWALEVAGVTRAWAEGNAPTGGQMRVLFVRDNDTDSIIPTASEVTAVQAYIDTKRPPTMITTVAAPTANALAWTINSLVVDTNSGLSLAQVQSNILKQRDDYLLRVAKPNTTLELEDMIQAIRTAFGVKSFTLTAPAADVTISATEIPTGGVITYT